MPPNTTEHSPHDHDEYSHWTDTGTNFPNVPPENLISFISPFDFYAHALFSSGDWNLRIATLFSDVGLYKFTSDTDTTTTTRESRFCVRRNIYTIVASYLATEDTICAVILSEESALLEQQFVKCFWELYIHEEYYRGTSCCYSTTAVKEQKEKKDTPYKLKSGYQT